MSRLRSLISASLAVVVGFGGIITRDEMFDLPHIENRLLEAQHPTPVGLRWGGRRFKQTVEGWLSMSGTVATQHIRAS